MLPSNTLEKLFREMYARRTNESNIADRIVRDIDPEKFRKITGSTLEGLAKKELNLSALVGKSVEAKERRLVPEIVEHFFLHAGPIAGVHPTPVRGREHVYKAGRVPKTLFPIAERLEARFGKLGQEYARIAFDKRFLKDDATLEWVTPGHPLLEAVRADVQARVDGDLRRGAFFWDLHAKAPYRLDAFAASIVDGRGATLHKRLFVVRVEFDGTPSLRQPTIFLDLVPAAKGTTYTAPTGLPDRNAVEAYLLAEKLVQFEAEVSEERARENRVVREHIDISLQELINRQQLSLAELLNRRIEGATIPGLEGNISQAEAHLDELNARLERRRHELEMERHCSIGQIDHLGRAWVLPHPDRLAPAIAPMVRDEEIERKAVEIAMAYERARGWVVESVENENKGYDLLSRKPHPSEEGIFIAARFIEVKGRAGVGEIALTSNEYRTAQRLGQDYFLYVVFDCATTPALKSIQDPAKLGWQPVVKVEHYQVDAKLILEAASE